MPISTPLQPEVIVGNKPKSIQSAQNFISGGAPLGSSVVSAAANKIVGFNRAGVRPVTPDINSLVKTISSNILNQVNNTVQSAINMNNRGIDRKLRTEVTSVTNQIQQIRQAQGTQVTQLQSIIQNIRNQTTSITQKLLSDYKDRIQKVDAAKPTNILGKFLETFNNALGFIRFFGNKKNIDELTNALKTLRTIFLDSFEVAKLVRQTIVKIVKQLSNLPKASPNSGGLNLDVNVPRGIKGNTKLPRFAKAAGIFGLGALGAGITSRAVNALSDVGVRQADAPSLMGNFSDRFSEIVDRFVSIVEGLSGKKKVESRNASSSAGGGASSSATASPSTTSPSGGTPSLSSTGEEGVLEYAQKKGFSEQFTAGLLTNVSHESGGNPFAYNPDDNGAPSYGLFQFRAGRGDNMIAYLEANGIPNAKELFTNPNDPRRNDEELKKKALALQIKYFTEDEKDQATPKITAAMKSTNLTEVQNAFFAGERFAGYDNPNSSEYRSRAADIQKIYNDLVKSGRLRSATAMTAGGMGGLGVDPSMIDLETKTLAASNIAQPPPTQQSTPTVLPLPMDNGGAPSKPAPNVMQAPPSTPNGSYAATLLGSSDVENFFTLYSKITFNIVDG